MLLDDVKQNINKIDYDLKGFFENVYITEKTGKSNYFVEISANKMFLFENCKKRVEVKAYINKEDLKFDYIKWSYSLNPLDESAERIERISNINYLGRDIYDIASNKRMVNEYFNSLESHVDLILEEIETDTILKNSKKLEIMEVVKKYNFKIKNAIANIPKANGGTIELEVEGIKMSDKFNIEKELLTNDNVNFVSFGNDSIKITLK